MAGSYLAASTFYVALTGSAVPDASEIPTGLDPSQATALRGAANIGAQCSDIRIKAAMQLLGSTGIDGPDGGPPFDFGTAGTSVPVVLYLRNHGGMSSTLWDGHTLTPPFEWTPKESSDDAGAAPWCGATLAPGEQCQVSVTFSGKSTGTSRVTLLTSDAYAPSITRSLVGTATDRALLTVSEWPDDGCLPCGPLYLYPFDSFTFVVMNRGALPAVAIEAGETLTSPLPWDGTGFPGGTGSGETVYPPTVTMPFCGSVLGPGEKCIVRIRIDHSRADAGGAQLPAFDAGPILDRTISIRYADAKGPIATPASRAVNVIDFR